MHPRYRQCPVTHHSQKRTSLIANINQGNMKPILHPKDYQIVKVNCVLIAIIIGLFSNWFWLFTITGISFIGNFVVLYNSISFQTDKEKTNRSPAVKGEITGQAITFAFYGLILTLVIGSVIRFIKITAF